jgi:hypothetical protein
MLFPGLLLVVTLLAGLAAPSPAAIQSPPCATAEARQFDFWVGEWTLTGTAFGGAAGPRETRATNSIRRTLSGCVIEEHFRMGGAAGGARFEGKSVSVWDAAGQRWRQTWVDNQGGYIALAGGWRDGAMILETGERPLPTGGTAIFRMMFHDITADGLVWDWERSADHGATWTTVWTLRYRRDR